MQHKWKKLTFNFTPHDEGFKCEVTIYGIIITSLIEDPQLIEGVKSEDRNLFREAMNKIYHHCREMYSKTKETSKKRPVATIQDGRIISIKSCRLNKGNWEYKTNSKYDWKKKGILIYNKDQIIHKVKNGIELSYYTGTRLGLRPVTIRKKKLKPLKHKAMTHKLVYSINEKDVETLVHGSKALCLYYRRKAKQTGNYKAGSLLLRKCQ